MRRHGPPAPCGWLVGLLALIQTKASIVGCAPLDVGGAYDEAASAKCFGMGGGPGDCTVQGCTYTPQIVMGNPDGDGLLDYTMQAADKSCWKGKMGPFPMHVDQCGRILGGIGGKGDDWWKHPEHFDPEKLDQDMDVMVMGNVLGFEGNPAGFEHAVIMQQNLTICSTDELAKGTCTPGHERLVCVERFAYCAGGDCKGKNVEALSPRDDAFFSRLTTTGLGGEYVLLPERSSAACNATMTVHQFGTKLGLGVPGADLHMTRLVDRSMASGDASCVQFYSECSGLQFHFSEGFAGGFVRDGDSYAMELLRIRPAPGGARPLALARCVYAATAPAPQLVEEYVNQHPVVVLLSFLLVIMTMVAGGLLMCCLTYRKQIIAVKLQQAYDIFQNPNDDV